MFTFGNVLALIDYLFIYFGYIKFNDKLKDKNKTHSSACEIFVFFLFCPKYIIYILFSII